MPKGVYPRAPAMTRHEFYVKHRPEISAARKKYYARNRKRIIAAVTAYYFRQKKYRGIPKRRAQIILAACRGRSKQRGLQCDLTREWIQTRIEHGKCELSEVAFVLPLREDGRPDPHAPSIDRIDNKKGYTQDNCRMILWCLNKALGEWGEALMLPLWKRVLDRKLK